MRRQRLRRGLGKGPEAHLRQGVGHEFGRQLAHALVDHVDDDGAGQRLASFVRQRPRSLRSKRLGEEERRPKVGADVTVPAFLRRGVDPVVVEDRSVVDQNVQRPAQRPGGPIHERFHVLGQQQVGLHHLCAPAGFAYVAHSLLGALRARGIMHRDLQPAAGKIDRHGAPEPRRGAGNQCGGICRHGRDSNYCNRINT